MEMASLRNAPNPDPVYEPVGNVNRPTVSTARAAFYLDRKVDTLQKWARYGKGPIKPIRVNNRLAWPVDQLKQLLGVA